MIKRILRFLFKFILWCFGLSIGLVLLYRFVPVPFTPLMAIRWVEAEKEHKIRHNWVPIEDISVGMQLAVICSEDQNFLSHNGFDYEAIKKAYAGNKSGKRLKGGSSISQQTAKNVFLWPNRSWLRKGMEAYFTFLIEILWSKERILEVYLNSIEMGDGIYGVEAASQYWFKKSAKKLNQHEAASIAVILPNPRVYKAAPRSPYLERRKQWIIKQMQNYGTFTLVKTEK